MFQAILRNVLVLLVLAASSVTIAFAAENRVALVIGNSAYLHTPELANPKNDADDMAAALQKLEFKVIKGLDLDKARMDRAIRDFAEASRGASLAVFFYAGHGLQVSGRNYLVPVDAQLKAIEALDFEMVGLDLVQRTMESASETNVLFVDACRDNPLSRNLARAMGTRSTAIGHGLVAVEAGSGTLISFSTQPGNVALDGTGSRNSPYAAALAKHISTQEKDLSAMLLLVRRDVMAATAKRQVPWEHSALTAEVRMAPSASAHKSASIATPEAAASPVSESGKANPGSGNTTESNTATANTAMTKTVQLAVKPEQPTAAIPNVIFSDSFDGDGPGTQWEIQKENKQSYVVENGTLLLATNKFGGLRSGNAENVFVLNDVSLDGDWDMSVKFRPSFKTGKDYFQIGTWAEGEASIRAMLSWQNDSNCQVLALSLNSFDGSQQAKKEAGFQIAIAEGAPFGSGYCPQYAGKEAAFRRLIDSLREKGATLTLSKRGRAYTAKFVSSVTPLRQTEELNVVRLGGRPVFGLSQSGETGGQTSVLIDEFRIERPKR